MIRQHLSSTKVNILIQQIETNICHRLYEIASDDGDPLRSSIVEAMNDVGSEAVLPTLEVILFDLEPSTKIRRMFAASLTSIEALETNSRAEFVKRVAIAIDNIKIRVDTASEVSPGTTTQTEELDETNNAIRAKKQAQRYIEEDPEIAIILIRRGAEALAKDLYRRLGHEQNGKPARRMMLEDLLKTVKESNVPDIFKLLVQTFQLFGNFVSHDQDEQLSFLTRNMAAAVLALYEEALLVYKRWSENSG